MKEGEKNGGNVFSKKCYKIHFNSMKCLTGHLFLGFSALLIIDIMQILYKTKKKQTFDTTRFCDYPFLVRSRCWVLGLHHD